MLSQHLLQENKRRYHEFKNKRIEHWTRVAADSHPHSLAGKYYHNRISQIYQTLIPTGSRVLEIGCGTGDLLASLSPSHGLGIDFSEEMIRIAKEKYPAIQFKCLDFHEVDVPEEAFEYIILSDLVNDVWDVQTIFENMHLFSNPNTRIILNSYSRLWEIPLNIARKIKVARPVLVQSWLTVPDLNYLLSLSGFESIRHWSEIILPLKLPLLTSLFNKILVRLWPLYHLAITNFIVARPQPSKQKKQQSPKVSIVIPARNEAGNIPRIYDLLPEFSSEFELIFVEGHSEDNTYQVIEQNIAMHPDIKSILIKQSTIGKGNAVREGFSQASGDILMILDADLTVHPEYLVRFYNAIVEGVGDLINGVRLVYPMDEKSMRFLNFIGNKTFSILFSWILGQPIKDTLCGTKVIKQSDYLKITEDRSFFGDFDPFGDFDLLLGAAKLNLKIVDIPVRYHERLYGKTNIHRWKHGWLLWKMAFFAIRKLKFQ